MSLCFCLISSSLPGIFCFFWFRLATRCHRKPAGFRVTDSLNKHTTVQKRKVVLFTFCPFYWLQRKCWIWDGLWKRGDALEAGWRGRKEKSKSEMFSFAFSPFLSCSFFVFSFLRLFPCGKCSSSHLEDIFRIWNEVLESRRVFSR